MLLGAVGVKVTAEPDLRSPVSGISSCMALATALAGALSSDSIIVPCAATVEVVVVLVESSPWGGTRRPCLISRPPS